MRVYVLYPHYFEDRPEEWPRSIEIILPPRYVFLTKEEADAATIKNPHLVIVEAEVGHEIPES